MLGVVLIILFLTGVYWLLSIQKKRGCKKNVKKVAQKVSCAKAQHGFVPIEGNIVPTHASQTNKFNNKIGNVNSSQGVGPGVLEVVIPSDFYQFSSRPGEYDWPSGSIMPDYIYNNDGIHRQL
jgi:hypothetical protein